jgi:hypothetical protein
LEWIIDSKRVAYALRLSMSAIFIVIPPLASRRLHDRKRH